VGRAVRRPAPPLRAGRDDRASSPQAAEVKALAQRVHRDARGPRVGGGAGGVAQRSSASRS
jgi:hypothetical protein